MPRSQRESPGGVGRPSRGARARGAGGPARWLKNKLTFRAKCQGGEGARGRPTAPHAGPRRLADGAGRPRAPTEAPTKWRRRGCGGRGAARGTPAAPAAAAAKGGAGGGRGGQGEQGRGGQGAALGGLRASGGRRLRAREGASRVPGRCRPVLALSAARVPGEQGRGVPRCLAGDSRAPGGWRGVAFGPSTPLVSGPTRTDLRLRTNFSRPPPPSCEPSSVRRRSRRRIPFARAFRVKRVLEAVSFASSLSLCLSSISTSRVVSQRVV